MIRHKRVFVFKDGYASDNKGTFDVPRDTPRDEVERLAKDKFGSWARVFQESNLPTYNHYGRYVPEQGELEALTNGVNLELHDTLGDLLATYDLTIAEAGPDWRHDEFVRERLDKLNKEIRAAYVEALQRHYRATPAPFDTSKDNS